MYSVMLVDDELWVLEKLRKMVDWGSFGFEIIGEATDSQRAWTKIRTLKPDVVFADICMPRLSGLELVQTARRHGVESEFLLVSGYDDFSFAKQAIASGVFYYFLKPINKQEMETELKRLHRHLRRRAQASDEPLTKSNVLNSILRYITANCAQPLTLTDIASRFHISQTYICDLFRKHLDQTFIGYLNSVRLTEAAKMLRETNFSVSMIAMETGFKNFSYFSEVFRREYNVSPSEYRSVKR